MHVLGIANRSSRVFNRKIASGSRSLLRLGDPTAPSVIAYAHHSGASCSHPLAHHSATEHSHPLAHHSGGGVRGAPLSHPAPRYFSSTPHLSAGHSHWQNIKQIKGANDAKKAAISQRVQRDIRVAIKLHGSANPKDNNELARIIAYARSENLPMETIERTLANCVADKSKPLETVTFECTGPAGALMILQMTSVNKHKMRCELNAIFKKHVASIVDGGGVMHSFDHKTMLTAKLEGEGGAAKAVDLEKAEETAIEVGAEEVLAGDFPGEIVFVTEPMEAGKVTKALEKSGYKVVDNVAEFVPKTIIELPKEAADELKSLKTKLEEHPDFTNIYLNCAP